MQPIGRMLSPVTGRLQNGLDAQHVRNAEFRAAVGQAIVPLVEATAQAVRDFAEGAAAAQEYVPQTVTIFTPDEGTHFAHFYRATNTVLLQ
jgi:hypothetical protein